MIDRLSLSLMVLVSSAWFSLLHAEERVLFSFDDHSIPWQHNLKLTLVSADKYPGNPVLRRGPKGSPDHGHACLYGTVIKDGERFRMWYLGMIESEVNLAVGQAPGYWRPMCYAESADGITWTKPDLGLVEIGGSKHNNACLIEGEPYSLTRINDFMSILYEPNDPDPARRYKAAYIAHVPVEEIRGGLSKIGEQRPRPCMTVCATSADGLRWKVVGDRPANAGGERFEVSSLYHFGNFYYTTGQLHSPWTWRADGSNVTRMMMAYRSPDFATWSQAKAASYARPGQLLPSPAPGQQMHMGAGLWNRGNVMVGLFGMWQDGPKERPKDAFRLWGTHIDLGLLISNDGIHYREPVVDFKVLSRGKEGDWDDIALLQCSGYVNEGEKTLIWYSHWDTSLKLKSMEIGLATLRRDGFGYLSRKQDDNDGHFITAPFPAGKASRMKINVEGVAPDAPLTLELLDERDRPIPGFSGADAVTIRANGTQNQIVWPKSRSPNLPAEKLLAARVRFPVNSQARVFALYVTD